MNHAHAHALLHLISEELETAQTEKMFLRKTVLLCRDCLEAGQDVPLERLEKVFETIDTALQWSED